MLGVVMVNGAKVTDVGKAPSASRSTEIKRELPVGVETGAGLRSAAKWSAKYVGEFLQSLGEALLIVLAVSFLSLGWRAGLVVALTIPLVLAATFVVMSLMGIDLQRISLGALIIALGLLVDDAMIAVEMMERKLRRGLRQAVRRQLRLYIHRVPDAHRHADHGRRLYPRGLCHIDGGRICEFAVLGGGHFADRVVVRRRLFHAVDRLQPAEAAPPCDRGREHKAFNGPFYRRLDGHHRLVRAAPASGGGDNARRVHR